MDIATKLRSSGPVNSFWENSELGLFITRGADLDYIYDLYSAGENIRSMFDGWEWHQEPNVILGPEGATVFAYYPYKETNFNGKAISIEHTSQTDYMYGTHASGYGQVNKFEPEVKLTMKHALALVQFNVFKQNYPHDRKLQRIEIMNSYLNVPAFYSSGTMDISTGGITYKEGAHESVLWENDGSVEIGNSPSDSDEVYAKLLIMPMQKTVGSGYVTVKFEIGHEMLTWTVPKGTEWKAGTKNTYTVFISGRELHVGDVFIEPWFPGIEETHPLD